ncbi:MAG: hypothetical protein DRJ40_11050 [Thermoprotei archaeon]|nr:MAG: hypothetical protein DRJ40_11050 [Thermoprotei archaeon]
MSADEETTREVVEVLAVTTDIEEMVYKELHAVMNYARFRLRGIPYTASIEYDEGRIALVIVVDTKKILEKRLKKKEDEVFARIMVRETKVPRRSVHEYETEEIRKENREETSTRKT